MKKISSISKMADIFMSAVTKLAKKHPSAGMLFYCSDDKTVLLTKRASHMNSPGSWDVQGGRHDDDDVSALDTAIREAKEEIKTLPSKKKLIAKHVLPPNEKGSEYVIHIYEISGEEKKKWTPKIHINHESEEFKWFPYDKLPKKTHFDMSWVKDAIDALSSAS